MSERPAYGVFTCGDGLRLSLGALEDRFWLALVECLSLTEWRDPAFVIYAKRMPAAQAINGSISEVLRLLDRADAVARLAAADIPVFEVLAPYDLPQTSSSWRAASTPKRAAGRFAAFRFTWMV